MLELNSRFIVMTTDEVTLDRPEVSMGFSVICLLYRLRRSRFTLNFSTEIFTPCGRFPPWSGYSEFVISSWQFFCTICNRDLKFIIFLSDQFFLSRSLGEDGRYLTIAPKDITGRLNGSPNRLSCGVFPICQEVLDILQMAIAFHRFWPPPFIKSWLCWKSLLYSSDGSFSDTICLWTDEVLKCGDSMLKSHMLSQIPSSCYCKWLLVCAMVPIILISISPSHVKILFYTDKIESIGSQDLVPRQRPDDYLWIHFPHWGLCYLQWSSHQTFPHAVELRQCVFWVKTPWFLNFCHFHKMFRIWFWRTACGCKQFFHLVCR